ncbi:MAG: bifunctional glycoside hydrolase 114/ polysaccharide deacetylase family protein [Acidiferrobacter sp.]
MPVAALIVLHKTPTAVGQNRRWWRCARLIYILGVIAIPFPAWAHELGIAFYYGAHPPVHELQAFRWVVVQPNRTLSPKRFDHAGHMAFAYTSVGEIFHPATRPGFPEKCILGRDPVWHTAILDESTRTCRHYYLHQVLAPLWKQGYRGFFLDNMDAYRGVTKTAVERQRQKQGLVELVRDIKRSHPKALLILNRGFRILPKIHTLVAAVVAESLFDGWSQKSGEYVRVPKSTRLRLITKLKRVRRMGIPVVAIDYLPPDKRSEAEADARRIEALGITPWITNSTLTILGVGAITVMPRTILMLYSGPQDVQHTSLNWYAAMPLNYLGYSTRIINIAHGLPEGTLTGRYAGIVTWFRSNHLPQSAMLSKWLRRQIHNGVPIAILGSFGFPADPSHLQTLGLTVGRVPRGLVPNRVAFANSRYIGFETRPAPAAPNNFLPLTLDAGQTLLRLRDTRGQEEDAVGVTPWGGYALSPDVVTYLGAIPGSRSNASAAWVLNPFRFFTKVLRLPAMPVPDTTTESGRRMLMAQIDGDGFANKSWIYRDRDQYAGDVILKRILEKYRTPTSASFIVSYFTPHGLFPHQAARLTQIARRIAELPWVEIGSHTFSHPFNWPALENNPALMGHKGNMRYGYALTVPGYTQFSARKEITWADRWINTHIAPPGKSVSLIQWSGDCDPDARVLALSYRDHVLNLNGGGATETDAEPFVTKVRGLGIYKGRYFQVYAPMQDENVYTHNWTSPYYYGYVRAIQTFKLTDTPRRLKPLDVYYHFYSGARIAGLRALRTVLSWAMRQRADPVFPSHFARIAVDFGHLVIARSAHGWLISHARALQELRIPVRMGFPRLTGTSGIAGYDRHGNVRYIHIAPRAMVRIRLTRNRPKVAFLHDANATITEAHYVGRNLHFALQGNEPLRLRLGNMRSCTIMARHKPLQGLRMGSLMTYHLNTNHDHFTISCP